MAPVTQMASIRFTCPHCHVAIKGKADKAGLRVKCPKCGLPCEVPLPKGQLLDSVPPPLAIESLSTLSASPQPQQPPKARGPRSNSTALIIAGTACGLAVLVCVVCASPTSAVRTIFHQLWAGFRL
jgi:hypothetical protein